MPKEGIIFGLFSNNVLYCGSKTVLYVGFEGLDLNLRAYCIESLRRLLYKEMVHWPLPKDFPREKF